MPVTVNIQRGVDLEFSSTDLTLSIDRFSERYLQSAILQLAQEIDADIHGLYPYLYNKAGTYGNTISKYAHFADGVRLADDYAVNNPRFGILAPTDWHSLAANFTSLPGAEPVATEALKTAKLPQVAGADIYKTQNVISHTNGAWAGTPVIDGNSQNVAYAGASATAVNTRNTWTQTLNIKGLTAGTSINAGDVFTIQNVNGVNPRSRNNLGYVQQFTVVSAVTADGAGKATVTISPPIMSDSTGASAAYQTVNAAPIDGATITLMGAGGAVSRENLILNKNAIALTMVPMILPPGSVNPARQSAKGLSIRVIPVYDGINDASMWRLDVLYGVTPLDPRQGVRLNGGS